MNTKEELTEIIGNVVVNDKGNRIRDVFHPEFVEKIVDDLIKHNVEAVVRCKDCIHWIPGRIAENGDFIQPRCERNGGGWSSDDYCSCAERREELHE